jgi:MFS family permease
VATSRWLRFAIVAFAFAQTVIWLFAGSIWWEFRGGLVWPWEEPSPSRIARDSYVAIAFFVVAGLSVAVLLPFLVRPGRRSVFLLSATQFIGALAAFAFTLLIETRWILITTLAVPTLALLYLYERSRRTHDHSASAGNGSSIR